MTLEHKTISDLEKEKFVETDDSQIAQRVSLEESQADSLEKLETSIDNIKVDADKLNNIEENTDEVETDLETVAANQTNGTQKTQIVDSEGNVGLVDDEVFAQASIEVEHYQVHEGKCYTVSYRSASVANDGYLRIRIKPVGVNAHVKVTYSSEGKALFKSYAGTTYSNNGTAITPWNRNIGSSNVSATLCYHTPTINVLGSQRADEFVGSAGAAVARAGGVGSGSIETVIQAGNDLLLELQNKSGSTSDLQMTINYYEI